MIIINFGIPGSGTILVNSVIREIMKLANRPVNALNAYPDWYERFLNSYTADRRGSWENAVLHLHNWSNNSDGFFRRCPSDFV